MTPVEGLLNPVVENHCAKPFHPEVTLHSSFLLVVMIELVSYASVRDSVSQEKLEKEGGRQPVSTSCFHPTCTYIETWIKIQHTQSIKNDTGNIAAEMWRKPY